MEEEEAAASDVSGGYLAPEEEYNYEETGQLNILLWKYFIKFWKYFIVSWKYFIVSWKYFIVSSIKNIF